MMLSYIRSAVRSLGLTVAVTFAAVALFVVTLATRAQALSISVGTPTVVNGAATIDNWHEAVGGNRVHVVYSTSSASGYTIMYASNTQGGAYSFVPISSGALANKPLYLTMALDSSDIPHVYYYDASSRTINYLIGNSATYQSPRFLLGGTDQRVTTTGLSINAHGSGFAIVYSSLNIAGTRYDLMYASATFGASSDTLDSNVGFVRLVTSTNTGGADSGVFRVYRNSSNGDRMVLYADSVLSQLRLLSLNSSNAVYKEEVLDTGSISSVHVEDSGQVTRVAYTRSGNTNYLIQRRKVSDCWYLQEIAQNASAQKVAGAQVSYINTSGALYLAKGQNGVYFDDFSESIVNKQQGVLKVSDNVTKGVIVQDIYNGIRGIFQPNSTGGNGLNSINWNRATGSVRDSWGVALPSIGINAAVSAGSGGGAATLVPGSSNLAGARTDSSGAYQVDIASGSQFTLTASSSTPDGLGTWLFFVSTNSLTRSLTRIITGSTADSSFGDSSLNFVGVSSPIMKSVSVNAWGNGYIVEGSTLGVAFTRSTTYTSTFTANSRAMHISDHFPAGGLFRFAPSGFTADPTTGTVAQFFAADLASRHIAVTGASSADNGVTETGLTATFAGVLASTDIASSKVYDLVYTTGVNQGTTIYLQGILRNALTLNPIKFDSASMDSGSGSAYAYANGSVITSTSTSFTLISLSSNGPVFPRAAAGEDPGKSVGDVFLSTSPTAATISLINSNALRLNVVSSSNSGVIHATASVFGLMNASNGSAYSWYVHISTKVNGIWQNFAYQTALTFSTPSITAVSIRNSDSVGAVYTDTYSVVTADINGTGFLMTGTSIWLTTSTVSSTNALYEGLPVIGARGANVNSFTVNSSTWATVSFAPKDFSSAGAGETYNIWIGTSILGTGTFLGGANSASLAVSTVLAYGSLGATRISVGTRAVTSVELAEDPSVSLLNTSTPVIANTQSYNFKLRGYGLFSSTLSFVAVDGSSETLSAACTQSTDLRVLTCNSVNFSGAVYGGKYYNVRLTTFPASFSGVSSGVYVTGMRTGADTFTNRAIWVSSLTVTTVTTPAIAYTANGLLYNSTSNVTMVFQGAGFLAGSSITFTNGSFNFTTHTVLSASVRNQGRSMLVVAPGSGTATYTQSGFLGAAAGLYDFSVTTAGVIGFGGGAGTHNAVSTGSIHILDASITSVSFSTDSAYSPIEFATATVIGKGLMPHATAWIRTTTGSNPPLPISAYASFAAFPGDSNSYSSGTVTFDLRTNTGTATDYVLYLESIGQGLSPFANASKQITGTVNINHNPIISEDSLYVGTTRNNSYRNGETTAYTLYGRGLSDGATLWFTHSGEANSHVAETALSSATFGVQISVNKDTGSSGRSASFTMSNKWLYTGNWTMTVSTGIGAGVYGASGKSVTLGADTVYSSTAAAVKFSVSESSQPAVPTGLTVLSAGIKHVTLQWVAPGNDHTTGALKSGSKFIIYYSSAEDVRGNSCGSCYPVMALNGTTQLTGYTTNFSFLNSWAQYLRTGDLESARSSTNTIMGYEFSTSTVKGLSVSTITITVGASSNVGVSSFTVRETTTSTSYTVDGNISSISPAQILSATLSIDPGTKNGTYFFIVRAMDQAGNISTGTVVYSTVSATILASADSTTRDTIDPNANTTLTSKDLGNGVQSGGYIPSGALGSADTLIRTTDSNPPTDTSATLVGGVAVDITLGSGLTEFLKPVTFSFTLSASALTLARSVSAALVKLAFYNGSRWVPVPNSTFDGTTVSGSVTHLTKFAPIIVTLPTDLSQAMVYPSPYRPSLSQHSQNLITFDRMPANTDVTIYTLAGDRVRDLHDSDGNGVEVWDAKNNHGENVASGVYFALLKGGGDTKTIKLAIQR